MGIFPIYSLVMSRTVAQPSPAKVPGATTPISVRAASNAIRRVIRTILRLAIRAGLRYPEIDKIVRAELVFEARTQIDSAQKDNASKLSMMTGLHRKYIAACLSELNTPVNRRSADTQRPRAATAQVFERWAYEARRKPKMRSLSLAGGGRRKGFADLARTIVTDVHPRAILDELIRLGLVAENGDEVQLLAETFTPKGESDELVNLLRDNAGAMLSTSVENVMKSRPSQLEQSIAGDGISIESAEKIAAIASARWRDAHESLFSAISDAPEASPSERKHRIRIGMYVNYEPMPDIPSR
jgi:hypothetical protein